MVFQGLSYSTLFFKSKTHIFALTVCAYRVQVPDHGVLVMELSSGLSFPARVSSAVSGPVLPSRQQHRLHSDQ